MRVGLKIRNNFVISCDLLNWLVLSIRAHTSLLIACGAILAIKYESSTLVVSIHHAITLHAWLAHSPVCVHVLFAARLGLNIGPPSSIKLMLLFWYLNLFPNWSFPVSHEIVPCSHLHMCILYVL